MESTSPLTIIQTIRAAYESSSTEEVGRLIVKFREEIGLNVQQFAEAMDISVPTYYRWKKDEKPPRHRIAAMERLALHSAPSCEPSPATPFPDVLWSFDQLLAQTKLCRTVWCFKDRSPLLTGEITGARGRFLDVIESDAVEFLFLLPPPRENSTAVEDSFAETKRAVLRRSKETARRCRAWKFSHASVAADFGLGNPFFSAYLLKYDPQRSAAVVEVRDRTVDIFLEIPMLLRNEDSSLKLNDENKLVQVSPSIAGRYWKENGAMLDALRKDDLGGLEGVTEFLATSDDLAAYAPGNSIEICS